jgi:hypothetical protein
MAAFNFVESFSEMLAEGAHDLDADTLIVYLSNATPSASLDAVKSDLAEITNENGYTAPIDIENATSRTGDTTTVTAVDKTVTADSGTVGPFRYVALANDDTTGDMLIGWWDYGEAITLQDTETFDIDFGSDSVLTVAPAA